MKRRILIVAAIVALTLPSLAQADGVTFAFDHRGDDNLFSFAANDPLADVTQIGPIGGLNYSPFAMDFDTSGSTLFVVDGTTIGTVDTTTGVFTAGPTLSGDWAGGTETGLSFDSSSSTVYLSDAANLYSVDIGTGATTLIGAFTGLDPNGAPIGTVIDIAVDNFGALFAHDIVTDSLWSIDIGTAAAYSSWIQWTRSKLCARHGFRSDKQLALCGDLYRWWDRQLRNLGHNNRCVHRGFGSTLVSGSRWVRTRIRNGD